MQLDSYVDRLIDMFYLTEVTLLMMKHQVSQFSAWVDHRRLLLGQGQRDFFKPSLNHFHGVPLLR